MASNLPPEQAVQDLPVKTVCLIALKTITGNLPALVQMALFPFLLSALITALSIPAFGSPLLSLLLGFLAYVPHTLFAVAWHRRTLLGLQQHESTSITVWGRDHWQFLFKIITLIAIFYSMILLGSMPVLTIGAALPNLTLPLLLGLMIASLYVVARLSFVLPATAVGEKYSLNNSWKHTEKQGWRLIGAFLLLTIPALILLMMIVMVIFGSFFSGLPTTPEEAEQFNAFNFIQNNGPSFFFLQLIVLGLTYFPMAAVISMLSIAFKGCAGWVPAKTEEKNNNDKSS